MRSWAFTVFFLVHPGAIQRRLGLPLSAARDVETRHGCPIDRYGDVAQNANQAGHAHRHATLLTSIAAAVRSVWGGPQVQKEPRDYLSYSATYRPDLACLYKEGGSHHLLADLKFLDPLSSVMTSIGRAGARVGFGNTRQLAEEKVLGRAARGDQSEGTFDPSKNTGHVSASPADYADALSKGHTVIPLLFETFGGFSPAAMRLLRRLRDQVSNTLSHAQYEETTWSARSWMAFQAQKISVALHLAAALEIACDLGHAGARAAEAAA